MTLVVQNHGHTVVRLVKGLRLGMVTPVDLVPDVDKCGADGEGSTCGETEDGEVRQLEQATSSGRGNKLSMQLKLELDHLTYSEQQKVKTLLTSYADVFALSTNELGTTDIVTHSIDTGGHPQVRPVRGTPFALRVKIDKLVQEMLDQKVVEPSNSLWASLIVLVQKKDGGVRFCVDY